MHPEIFIRNRLGIKQEYPKESLAAAFAIVIASDAFCHITHTTIQGKLPTEGPAILIANHTSTGDILRISYAVRITSGRIVRGVARHTLLSPNEEESTTVIKKIGKKKDLLNSDHPLAKLLVREPLAFVLRGIGAIPIHRGVSDITAFRTINRTLREGNIVGIFLQQERIKEATLRDLMPGPALIAATNPNIPIIFAGISGPPDGLNIININSAPTYAINLNIDRKSKESLANTTIYFGDELAKLLPDRVQTDWAARRDQEYKRLTA